MTTAERIVREATAAGREAGLEAGRTEEARRTLLRQVEHRFGHLPPVVAQRIHGATLLQLEAWLDRIFDLRAPEDLLEAS